MAAKDILSLKLHDGCFIIMLVMVVTHNTPDTFNSSADKKKYYSIYMRYDSQAMQ